MRWLHTATTVPTNAGRFSAYPALPLPFWHECSSAWQRLSCQHVLNLLPLLLALQTPAFPAPTAGLAAAPYVRVLGAASDASGKLSGWAEGGPVLQSGFSTSDWLLVDFHQAGQPAAAGALQLNDGAWLPGTPTPQLGESPAWTLADLPGVAPLPLNTLWVQSFGSDRHPQVLADKDHLWVRTSNGSVDQQRGYLLEWGAKGLVFETASGAREFDWSRVLGLGLLPEQTPPQHQAVWIQLTNGGVLSAHVVAFLDNHFELELAWGQHWSLPVFAVQRMRRRFDVEELGFADAWQVLTSPASQALDWSPRFGKSVEGRPLRLGTSVYAQGIGVKATTELQREVPQAGLLLLTVGVDREVEYFRDPQPVVFEVWFEQTLLISSGPRHFQDPPLVLKVAVPKAGTLRLLAKPAGVLPFAAHADFVDVVWLRTIAK